MDYPNRKSIRLSGYDYRQCGLYFVTICTYQKLMLFGKIQDGKSYLNPIGRIVREELLKTNLLRKDTGIQIAQAIIMPNHVHFIASFLEKDDIAYSEMEFERFSKPLAASLSSVVRALKSAVTKQIHALYGTEYPYEKIWQSRYYEHIIGNDEELNQIITYIQENPIRWENDYFYG